PRVGVVEDSGPKGEASPAWRGLHGTRPQEQNFSRLAPREIGGLNSALAQKQRTFGVRVDSELDVLEGKISVQVVGRTNGRPRNPIAFLGDSLLSCVAPWRFRAKVRTSRLTHPKNTKATMKSHSRTKGPIFSMRLRGPHAAGRVLESIKKITGELEDLQAEI